MLAQVLGAELGAGTVMAPDEAEALEWACRVATDVVLLDLMPPPVHGCPVARELPADRRARSAAIVAISAMTPVEQVRTRVLEAGCDDFVARPFRIDDRPKTQRQASAAAEGVQHGGTIFWPEQGVAETADPIPYPFGKGEPLTTDAARAKQLLGGKTYDVELVTYPQRPELGLMATAIQAMLKEVGINAQIKSVESITPIVEKGDYAATMYSLQNAPTGDPSYIANILYHSKGAWNSQIGYQSTRFDAAAEKLTAETDPAKRIEAAKAASAILNEDATVVFLGSPMYHKLLSAKVKGFEPSPLEAYFLAHTTSLE